MMRLRGIFVPKLKNGTPEKPEFSYRFLCYGYLTCKLYEVVCLYISKIEGQYGKLDQG